MTRAAQPPLVDAAAATNAIPICDHCGLPLAPIDQGPPGQAQFCCAGCAAAFAFIAELGLGRFYTGRQGDRHRRAARPVFNGSTALGRRDDLGSYALPGADGTHRITLAIDGLYCAACVWLIEQALRQDPAVVDARVNLTGGRLSLTWRGPAGYGTALAVTVERLGYRVAPFAESAGSTGDERALLTAMAAAGFASANVMLLSISVWAGGGDMGPATRDLMHWVSALIALPAIAYSGRPFFSSAAGALIALRTNMDVPISIGIGLAAAMSLWQTARSAPEAYFESPIMLLFFLLVGRYLDRRARGRARSTVERLLALGTAPVTVVGADGTPQAVRPTSVRPGDIVVVAAGERIGVDGIVQDGLSSVDQSLIDGESMPRAVAPGGTVLAGMVNLTAPLRVTVGAVGDATFLAEVARLMEAAERSRARLVVLADRIARRYAPAVHGLSLATLVGWLFLAPWQTAVQNAISVLIITCPCALGLAVPVVQVVAGNRLFERGILLKSATALERLGAVDTVAFDKTGTVTLARPRLSNHPPTEALRAAAALAGVSRHPLSRALCEAMPGVAPAMGVLEVPGAGLSLRMASGIVRLGHRDFCGVIDRVDDDDPAAALWLTRPGEAAVRFSFVDRLRPAAAAVVERLRTSGRRVLLLSGDRPAAVAKVAAQIGIAETYSRLAPADKVAVLQDLAAAGATVLMVGDGLNDAPALAAAHVSMSPSTAADVSQTAADIVFQGPSLTAVTDVLDIARRSRRLVFENIVFAIGYNVVAVPIAMLGRATPLVAAVAMSLSSLVVVLNALRLAPQEVHR